MHAVGADGEDATPIGVSGGPLPGGTGGMVSGDLSVGAGSAITPGETLYVAVGGTPTESNGGFNGGGNGNANGRGGGGGGGERCAHLLADVDVLRERGYEPAGASDCRRR